MAGPEDGVRAVGTDFNHPVVLSRALASRMFPAESAIGRTIHRLTENGEVAFTYDFATRTRTDNAPYTVVGVVEDVRDASPREAAQEIVYIPIVEPRVEPGFAPMNATLVIRTEGSPLAVASGVRLAVGETDPDVSIGRVQAMTDVVRLATARERILAFLLAIAGTAALLVGAIGVYGVVAHGMRLRVREFGVRLALGASAHQIVATGLVSSSRLAIIGLSLGLIVALAISGLVRSMLFGVEPRDPPVFIGAAIVVGSVTLISGLLPSGRAARVDPMTTLRAE
jgi:hypothetical protein